MSDDPTLAGGTGNALDASVGIEETPPDQAPSAEETEAAALQGRRESAAAHVAAAQKRVEKAQYHLDGANVALANATAEQEAIG